VQSRSAIGQIDTSVRDPRLVGPGVAVPRERFDHGVRVRRRERFDQRAQPVSVGPGDERPRQPGDRTFIVGLLERGDDGERGDRPGDIADASALGLGDRHLRGPEHVEQVGR
jgi:hypothetical protein